MFLIAKVLDWEKLNNEAKGFWAYGRAKKNSKAMMTTWMDLPLESVKKVSAPSGLLNVNTKNQLVIEFDIVNKTGFLGAFRKNPTIIVHLDNRDMWRTQIEFHKKSKLGVTTNQSVKLEERKLEEIELKEMERVEEEKAATKRKIKIPKTAKKSKSNKKSKKFCGDCGYEVSNSIKFCSKCGSRV